MRLEYCLNPNDSSISKMGTRLWVCSAEQASEYHVACSAPADIGMGEAFMLEGSADTTIFELSIEQILAPSLQAGQIVILDNLHTHTGERVRRSSRPHGDANSCFFPPTLLTCRQSKKHSTRLKAFLRRVGARTPEAIGQALLTITPHDAFGWFTHCGYSREKKPL